MSPIQPKHTSAQLHHMVPPDWYERSVRENLLQRFWHSRRIAEVTRLSEKVDGEVLDIGSADGYFTRRLLSAAQARKIIGIDVLKRSVVYARRRYRRNSRMHFRVGDAHRLQFTANRFGAVFMLEALEHVFDPNRVIREIFRVLRPGGYTIILVPSENWLFRLGWPIWLKTRGRIWNDTHLHAFSGNRLPEMLKEAGFENVFSTTFILGMLLLIKAEKPKKRLK